MRYIDMHCDTLMSYAMEKDYDIYESDKMIDIKKLKKGECTAQFFAMYMPPVEMMRNPQMGVETDEDYISALSNGLFDALKKHPEDLVSARNAKEWKENDLQDKISAILTIEDGRPVDGKLGNIDRFYDMGVRLISLTHNFENCFGYPNSDEPEIMGKGLKDFGREAVEYMNDKGIIVDVSHLSDGGFYDVADISKVPFVASHSDCREITKHRRNLTDEMIRIVADKGGCIGINFNPPFMIPDKGLKNGTDMVMIDHMVMHLKHMIDVGGIGVAAIGTDYDGIHGNFEIPYASGMQELFERLRFAGFTDSEVEKIAYKNVVRVMTDTMK